MEELKNVSSLYPPTSKDVKPEKREIATITTAVVRKKKSFGRKALEIFIPEDIGSIRDYIVHDILIPALRETISDMLHGVTDAVLNGSANVRGSRIKRDRGKSYVSYNSVSSKREERTPVLSAQNRARHNFDEFVFKESRAKAEEVLSDLVDLTIDYPEAGARVSDFYTMVGITGDFPDDAWGWRDLSTAEVKRVRDGWIIQFPKTIHLD